MCGGGTFYVNVKCLKVGAVLPILTSPFEDQLKGFQCVFRSRVLPHPFSDMVLEIWRDHNLIVWNTFLLYIFLNIHLHSLTPFSTHFV